MSIQNKISRPNSHHSSSGRPPRCDSRIEELIKRTKALVQQGRQEYLQAGERKSQADLPPLNSANDYRLPQSDRFQVHSTQNSRDSSVTSGGNDAATVANITTAKKYLPHSNSHKITSQVTQASNSSRTHKSKKQLDTSYQEEYSQDLTEESELSTLRGDRMRRGNSKTSTNGETASYKNYYCYEKLKGDERLPSQRLMQQQRSLCTEQNQQYKDLEEGFVARQMVPNQQRRTSASRERIVNYVKDRQQQKSISNKENRPPRSSQSSLTKKAPELPPLVTARCWAVYDAQSMKYLDGKNPYTSREVASLTKVMTFYTTLKVFERLGIDDFDGVHFKVTRYATSMNGTSARLRSGTWITLKDLFYALMLPSGNDAAIVLAENVGTVLILAKNRTEDLRELLTAEKRDLFFEELMQQQHPIFTFVHEMNRYARELLLCSTNYANPHGLRNRDNKSSAYDVAKLCCQAMKIPIFAKVVSTVHHTCRLQVEQGGRCILEELRWENTNKLLLRDGWYGVKTGVTEAAGPCLASCVKYYDSKKKMPRHFLVVILNSKSMDHRWDECQSIAQWAMRTLCDR